MLNNKRENGNGLCWQKEPFQHFIVVHSPLLINSLTSGKIIGSLIRCHFRQSQSVTRSSELRADSWGVKKLQGLVMKRLSYGGQDLQHGHTTVWLFRQINEQDNRKLFFRLATINVLDVFHIVSPTCKSFKHVVSFLFPYIYCKLDFLWGYLLSRSSRVGRIFISVNFSEYCHPVQDDHSIPSA